MNSAGKSNKPSAQAWYYRDENLPNSPEKGPLTSAQMLALASKGEITLATPVKTSSIANNQWIPAGKIAAIAAKINEHSALAEKRKGAPPKLRNGGSAVPGEKGIESIDPPDRAPDSPADRFDDFGESNSLFGEDLPSSSDYVPISPFSTQTLAAVAPQRTAKSTTTPSNSTERYPKLHKYLGVLKAFVIVAFIFAFLVAAGMIVIGLMNGLRDTFNKPLSLSDFIFDTFIPALVIFGAGYFNYVLAMAAIEFVKVILDIEANTRKS